MAKPIQYCKVKIIIIIKLEKKIHLLDVFTVGSLIYVVHFALDSTVLVFL